MPFSVSSLNGGRAADNNGSAVDLSKLSADPRKIASGNPASEKPRSSSAVRTALGPGSVALKPQEVKDLATSFLETARKIVDTTFAPFITPASAPPPKLRLLTTAQVRADRPGENIDKVIAYTNNEKPGIINVAFQSPMFSNAGINARDFKLFLVHEMLHTRSAAFSFNIAETYGKPLANGKPATFSDGSQVRGITEGLTEAYALMATSQKPSPGVYTNELKWAYKLAGKVDPDTIAKAYFGNDAASMAKVKRAINELVAEDKISPASARSR